MAGIHDQLLQLILACATDITMSFDDKSRAVLEFINALDTTTLRALLGEAGFIPEEYPHDSSEEKVYAKAMDALVAVSLSRVGYRAEVGSERSNAADVIAESSGNCSHTLVLDAKAFRLSRTALNPKDYKIEALSTWKKGANYACLVGPLAGFPEEDSRLFGEALKFEVTLLTFSHLQFMLEHGLPAPDALASLWNSAPQIQTVIGQTPGATAYWVEIDRKFCDALNTSLTAWTAARRRYFTAMLEVADKQVQYFEGEKARIRSLPRNDLVELALRALKLDSKISVVQAKKRKAVGLLASMERSES